jgi:probable rRNA maturation factor
MTVRLRVIENRQRRVWLRVPELERFLLRINRLLRLRPDAAFVRLVTDAEMQRLNRKFRNQPKATDVLSFPSETRTRPRVLGARTRQLHRSYLGDIAISPAVAGRNAKAFGRTLSEEICILTLHGVLHLLGYDHETDGGEMERVEATLRSRLGLS